MQNKKPYPILDRVFKRKSRTESRNFGTNTLFQKKKELVFFRQAQIKKGNDILSHITAVPSAQAGLTSLFEMGRGEPRRNNHLKKFA